MIIKKYQASTEKDAMLLVKEELGKDAIIMNIKHTKPKGIYRFLKKSVVEVTAAIDDTPKEPVVHQTSKNEMFKSDKNSPWTSEYNQALSRGDIILDHREVQNVNAEEANTAIEMKLDTLQTMIEEQITKREVKTIKKEESVFDLPCVKLIKEQLMENELSAENTQTILNEIEASISKDSSVDNVLANIYQKIVLKIGQPKTIHLEEGSTKFVFFIGPTGVGKTTTIAKIASSMKLRSNIKVALVTLDTYRIAAVEQLRTYANILNIPISVVYSNEELERVKQEYKEYDIVLVDTAGRSHKNIEQVDDIQDMISMIPEELREIYLVLSATTKYKDMIHITERYKEISDYNLIFTKLDETISVGNILNIKLLTQALLSYITWGQNVPDDIGKVNPQKIAKQLLGGNN